MSAEESITSLPEAVAALGALPVPAGTAPQESESSTLAGYKRAYADAVATVARQSKKIAELERIANAERARVAELEAERHSTNEALDDAVQALRAVKASGGTYPPALPWAALMDDEDRTEFLDELAESATVHASSDVVLAEVEKTCATWRLIAEAQHGHNTASGPDAVSVDEDECTCPPVDRPEPHCTDCPLEDAPCPVDGPIPGVGSGSDAPEMRALRAALYGPPDGEHYAQVHHVYRLGHDLPETGGASDPMACKACGSMPDQWCPDCGCCQKGCYDGHVDNPCTHPNTSWATS